MLHVIGPVRTRTFRVLWMLEELGLDYTHDPAPPRSDPVLTENPGGKVPVLVTEDGPLWDSVAILTWLGDRFGGMTHPAGSFARARQDGFTGLVVDEMDQVLWAAARHSFILPEDKRVPAIKDSLRWEFARNQKKLAARMDGSPFLVGDTPTIPDIILTHCCNWAAGAKFEVAEPAIRDLADRMRARGAYQRVQAL